MVMGMGQRLQQRIAGRRAAAECFELLTGDKEHPHYWEAFVDEIKELSGLKAAERVVEPPQSREPIARLGATEMPFGEHKGRSFDDVPLDYLDWLCRSQEDFYRMLRAYLKHPDLESRRQ